MAELDETKKAEIDALIKQALNNFDPNDIKQAVNLLEEAWSALPLPKEKWYDSFLIAKYLTHAYFNSGDFENALTWAKTFNEADPTRDYGESEFMLAKVLYNIDRKVEAKEMFKIAEEKSDGRVWKGEKDLQYFKFYKRK